MKRLIVGIGGGTASGKTTVCKAVVDRFGIGVITYFPCDSYYKDVVPTTFENQVYLNLDHPDAFEIDLLVRHLEALASGHSIERPVFDFIARQRSSEKEILTPGATILVDGIIVLIEEKVRSLLDVKVFLDEESDVRFIRRLMRDTTDRGRSIESVIKQYLATVRPMHKAFIEPSREYADIEGKSDQTTIDRICQRILSHLQSSS